MSKQITNLLALRTIAIAQFRIAFRKNGPVENLRREINQLNQRINQGAKS